MVGTDQNIDHHQQYNLSGPGPGQGPGQGQGPGPGQRPGSEQVKGLEL